MAILIEEMMINDDKSVDVMGYFTLVSMKLIWKKGFKSINFINFP